MRRRQCRLGGRVGECGVGRSKGGRGGESVLPPLNSKPKIERGGWGGEGVGTGACYATGWTCAQSQVLEKKGKGQGLLVWFTLQERHRPKMIGAG